MVNRVRYSRESPKATPRHKATHDSRTNDQVVVSVGWLQGQKRLVANPLAASPSQIFAVQRQFGNRSVTRLLQSAGAESVQREPQTVDVDLEVPTPEEAKKLRDHGVELPTASAKGSDPRLHSDFLDRRVTAVGFGIYIGGYYLYVDGLDLPVFLPNELVAPHIAKVTNFDNVIYPSHNEAMKAVSAVKSTAERGVPMTYFRGPGGLVVPLYVTPATAPITYKTMVGAQQELGRQVSRELTVLAASMVGGMLIKAGIRLVMGVPGRFYKPKVQADPTMPAGEGATNKYGDMTYSSQGTKADVAGRFYKPKVQADPTMPAGEGATNKYGDVTYSSQGTKADVDLARFHESVHSALSPKLMRLREFRADLGMTAYKKSQFLQYLEEALAETYAQLRVNGIKGLPTGIRFPIKNGYVALSSVVTEFVIGTVTVGGVTYGVYVVAQNSANSAKSRH